MGRAERRRMERNQLYKQRRIRTLQNHIQQLRMEGVLPFPKPSLWQRIKNGFRSFLEKRLNK